MADNILSGTVPTFLRSLSNLKQLDLSTNSFTGGVPSFVAAFRNLTCVVPVLHAGSVLL